LIVGIVGKKLAHLNPCEKPPKNVNNSKKKSKKNTMEKQTN
jgi:hypothetical protein